MSQYFVSAPLVPLSTTIGVMCVFVSDLIGRRWANILFSAPLVLNWIVLYHAETFPALMTSRFLAGLSTGPICSISLVSMAEYSSTESRPILLSVISMIAPAFGNAVGHLIGIVIHWRTLTIFGFSLSIIHLILPYFWTESPQWLAYKGRFEDCETSFRELHGSNPRSEEELRLLIEMETCKQNAGTNRNVNSLSKCLLPMRRKYFRELLLLGMFLLVYYAAAGKLIFSALATVILEDITGSSNIFLYTLVVDGFVLLGTCLSCVLIRKCTIRFLLFSSGLIANIVLMLLSACIYFKNSEVYYQWINVLLLAFYFIIVNAGPYPVIEIAFGEMFPLEIKMCAYLLLGPMISLTLGFSILFLPYLISVMGYHGLFLMNAGIMFVSLGYFYAKLPETKNKTLQEIESFVKTKNYDVDEVLRQNDQIKTLL